MILLTRSRNQLFTHRAIDVTEGGRVLTRADRGEQVDPWCEPECVLGRVVAVRSPFGVRLRLDRRDFTHTRLAGFAMFRFCLQVVARIRSVTSRVRWRSRPR
jgi:hypothetical protein